MPGVNLSSWITRVIRPTALEGPHARVVGEHGEDHSADRATAYRMLFDQSAENLKQQGAVLDGLRSRSGLLLTAANVITALLAGPAIEQRGLSPAVVAALITFVLAVGMTLWILKPARGWSFSLEVGAMLSDVDSKGENLDLVALYRKAARTNVKSADQNVAKLDRLFDLFMWASILLMVEIGAWIVALLEWNVGGVDL